MNKIEDEKPTVLDLFEDVISYVSQIFDNPFFMMALKSSDKLLCLLLC